MNSKTRPLTESERKALKAMSKNPFTWRSALEMAVFFSFLTSCLIILLGRFVSFVHALQTYLIFLTLLGWFLFSLRSHIQNSKRYSTTPYQKDMQQGTACILSYAATSAIRVQESEDEGSHYFIRLFDGSVLFLSGQYLYEVEEDKIFPCTDFDVVRTPNAGAFLDIVCRGSYFPPEKVLGPFRRDLFRSGKLPSDGAIVPTTWDKIEEQFTERSTAPDRKKNTPASR